MQTKIQGITLENLKKLGVAKNQTKHIPLEDFQEAMCSVGA